MNRATTALLLVVAAILAPACGSAVEETAPGPTVADARFGGRFTVVGLDVDGAPQDLAGPIEFDIDSEFGTLRTTTPCGTLLGSFSFFEDGRAGVTVSGGSTVSCSAGAEAQRSDLLLALGRVSSWTESGSGLVLLSAEGDSVTLSRQPLG